MATQYGFLPAEDQSEQHKTVSVSIYRLFCGKKDGRVKTFWGAASDWEKVNAAARAWCNQMNTCEERQQKAVIKIGKAKEKVK